MPISCARVSTRRQIQALPGQHQKNAQYAQLLNKAITGSCQYVNSGELIVFQELINQPPDDLIFVSVDRFGRNKNEGVFWARSLALHGHVLHFIEDKLIISAMSSNRIWKKFSDYLGHAEFELSRIRYRAARRF